MIIFFDTETTGLIPGRIVQLSYLMVDKESVKAKNFFFAVEYVEPSAVKVHGFTPEKLSELSKGHTFSTDCDEIYEDFKSADVIIAHNVKFDIGFMIAEYRYMDTNFRYNESFDTCRAFAPICQLKREHHNQYKYPKLTELTEFLEIYPYDVNKKVSELFGIDVLDCHDARYDTVALYLSFMLAKDTYEQIKAVYEKYI